MWIEFAGDLLLILGEILIALAVLSVHNTVLKERKIDKAVGKTIQKEQLLIYLGIALLVGGFALRQLGNYLL